MRPIKKVEEALRKNRRFLITTHVNLEGDALGSCLGAAYLIRKMGKDAVVVLEEKPGPRYSFLPGVDKIRKYQADMWGIDFDCFLLVDCSDLERCGNVYKLNSANKPVINIDHHISNANFGEVNWVEPEASSASEMIYRLYKDLKYPLDKSMSLLLYTGILMDSGSFRYTNTSAYTHYIAADLLKYGLDAAGIYNKLYSNIPYEDMRLLVRVVSGMRRSLSGKIIWFEAGRGILKKKADFDLGENILSFGRTIKDAEVVLLFKEIFGEKNEVRVNLRSQGRVDVNRIAGFFGGGGHKTAAGCTVKGSLQEVEKKVLSKIKELYVNYS